MKRIKRPPRSMLPAVDPRQLGFAEVLLTEASTLEVQAKQKLLSLQKAHCPNVQRELIALDRQIESLYAEMGILTGQRPRRLA